MSLIIGAVMSGRTLVHTAELRAVINEVKEYKIAIDAFKTQYEGLPGDLKNAEDFFGSSQTSNGNDNGRIDEAEYFPVWDQLALARMVTGTFSGTGSEAEIGINVPAVREINNAGYSLAWQTAPGPSTGWVDGLNRTFRNNYLIIAGETSSSTLLENGVISGEDAAFIDEKVDDGEPDYGSVLAENGDSVTGCTEGVNPAVDTEYDFTSSDASCRMYFAIE